MGACTHSDEIWSCYLQTHRQSCPGPRGGHADAAPRPGITRVERRLHHRSVRGLPGPHRESWRIALPFIVRSIKPGPAPKRLETGARAPPNCTGLHRAPSVGFGADASSTRHTIERLFSRSAAFTDRPMSTSATTDAGTPAQPGRRPTPTRAPAADPSAHTSAHLRQSCAAAFRRIPSMSSDGLFGEREVTQGRAQNLGHGRDRAAQPT